MPQIRHRKRVLVVGATGFIGARLARLLSAHHEVVALARSKRRLSALAPWCETVAVDPGRLETPAAWAPYLDKVDAVVNALGIIEGDFERLHVRVPKALFEACAAAKVGKVVQVSALGAAPDAPTAFLRSKAAADAHLAAMEGLEWTIVRPSIVIGAGGGSARLFAAMGALPRVPALGDGGGLVQPIHVGDLCAGLERLVDMPHAGSHAIIAATGPEPVHVDELLDWHRRWLGLPPAGRLRVPAGLVAGLAPVGRLIGLGPVSGDTLRMLRAGNTADPEAFVAATGVLPSGLDEIRRRRPASPGERLAARSFFLRPLLRLSLAFLWLWTALVSFGWYPVEGSYRLLAAVGAPVALQPPLLYGAALWDALLGGLLLVGHRVRLVGWLQVATILVFTLIVTVALPQFWLHPFGPIAKNIPVIAATLLMIALEDDR